MFDRSPRLTMVLRRQLERLCHILGHNFRCVDYMAPSVRSTPHFHYCLIESAVAGDRHAAFMQRTLRLSVSM